MSTYILVHGAWMGGWAWEKVAGLLRRAGHTVEAPDLPAHGQDTTPAAQASLAGYAEAIAARVDAQREPVILVGHSMGGIILSEVAERRPEKVKALVYVAAHLLQSGQSLFQVAMQDTGARMGPYLAPDEANGLIGLKPEGYGVALEGCPEQEIATAAARARPEIIAPLATPITVTPERFGRVRRFYVETLNDGSLSLGLQRAMYAALPCERVFSLEGGHTPLLSAPEKLVEVLTAVA